MVLLPALRTLVLLWVLVWLRGLRSGAALVLWMGVDLCGWGCARPLDGRVGLRSASGSVRLGLRSSSGWACASCRSVRCRNIFRRSISIFSTPRWGNPFRKDRLRSSF